MFFSIYEGGSLCENLIDGGKRGISIHSTLLEGEQLQIKAAYTLKVPVPFFSGLRFRKKTTVKRRIFSGYVKHWGEYEEAGDNQIVYVAENGVVYHKDSSCSHIHFFYSYHNYLPEAQREHGRKFPTSFNFTAFIVLFNPLHPSVE